MPNGETPFFVSYPRTDTRSRNAGNNASDRLVQRFFKSLCEDVAPLIHLPLGGEMGFLDVEGMPGGTIWHPELRSALGKCQVMVALLCVPYLRSMWCGKEWHAFASRPRILNKDADLNQGSIIPVLWAPIADGFEIPSAVTDDVNIFSPKGTGRNPELPQQYAKYGLFGLLHENEDDAASEVIWQLALLIQKIYYNQQLESRDFESDDLINIFEEGPGD